MGQLEGANPAVGGKIGIENDELGMPLGQLEQRLAVGLGDVLVSHLRSSPRARLGLTLQAVDTIALELLHRHELEVRKTFPDAVDELRMCSREVVVRRGAGVPAVRPTTFAQGERVLHEADALAFDRVRNQRLWSPLLR